MMKKLCKRFGILAGLFFAVQASAPAWAISALTQIPASGYTTQSGVQLETSTEGGQNVAFIDNGDYTAYNNIEFAAGVTSFSARVASNTSGGAIEIRTGSATGALAGTCTVPNTGGWQNWTTVTCPVNGLSSTQTLFLRYTGGTGSLFNIRWFNFTAALPPVLSAFIQIEAENFTTQAGTQTEVSSEGGQNIGYIDNGDYLHFLAINFGSGASSFTARVASAGTGGAIEIRTGTPTGTLLGSCAVAPTGGWQTWTTVTCPISNVTGIQQLYLRFTGAGAGLFNINWFRFSAINSISAFNQIEAESFNSQAGVQAEASSEGGQNIGWIENGDYIAFNAVNFNNGAASFTARVASAGIGGAIEIRTGNANGALAGTCPVPVTGGWQTWTTVNCNVNGLSGVQALYLKFTGGAGALFNLNWFKFNTTPQNNGGDVVGKITVGYQGWFNAQGDGSPFGCWFHWSNNCNAPTPNTNVKFELYPDTREYSRLYQSNLANLANGTPARLFSSYDQSTVNKHFEWMQTYNIDTAAVQRFGANVSSAPDGYRDNRDLVAVKVKNAAETYARKFYVMYDITGLNSDWVAAIKSDWSNNVVNKLQLTYSNAYARQDGKIVVCIWGLGFTHTPGTAAETLELINWFKNQNIYVIGGVPTYWRTGAANSDAKPGFIDAFRALNMISPWLVGRFDINGIDHFRNNVFPADVTFAQQNNLVYQPVLFPGFAWSNMYPNNPRNQIPRVHGDFMWKQAYTMKSLGVNTAYIAMFDEYDEGTAIAKAAENLSMVPTNQYFLTLDADGVAVSADFYLRLTNDIGRLMRGDIPLTAQHPTTHQ